MSDASLFHDNSELAERYSELSTQNLELGMVMEKEIKDDFSRAFYPFLHEEKGQSADLMAELRFSLLEKIRESIEVKTRFFEDQQETILSAALALARVFHRGRKLLVCGNG